MFFNWVVIFIYFLLLFYLFDFHSLSILCYILCYMYRDIYNVIWTIYHQIQINLDIGTVKQADNMNDTSKAIRYIFNILIDTKIRKVLDITKYIKNYIAIDSLIINNLACLLSLIFIKFSIWTRLSLETHLRKVLLPRCIGISNHISQDAQLIDLFHQHYPNLCI